MAKSYLEVQGSELSRIKFLDENKGLIALQNFDKLVCGHSVMIFYFDELMNEAFNKMTWNPLELTITTGYWE